MAFKIKIVEGYKVCLVYFARLSRIKIFFARSANIVTSNKRQHYRKVYKPLFSKSIMTNKIVVDVMPRGLVSVMVDTKPFDVAKNLLEEAGYHIPCLEENAELRMQEGENSPVCNLGNYVSDGILYVPQKGIFWTPNSPIMKTLEKATQGHRNRSEFYLTLEQVEESLVDAVEINSKPISTNIFGENEFTAKVFGKNAQVYGDFLRDSRYEIQEMPIWLADISDKPFARQMWFGRLGGRSELNDGNRNLNDSSRVRGVKRVA